MFEKKIKRSRFTLLFFTIFIAYLFIFSSFALYHIYAENELSNSGACAIGDCVLYGQALITFVAALSTFLFAISSQATEKQIFFELTESTLDFSRGPPFSLILS